MIHRTRIEAIAILAVLLVSGLALAGMSPSASVARPAGSVRGLAAPIFIGIPTPMNDETIGTSTPTIRVPYQDTNPGARIVTVSFFLDGMNLTSAGTLYPNAYTVSLAFELQSGPHVASFAIADNATGSGSLSWRFIVDTLPPVLLVTEPVYPTVPTSGVFVNGTAFLANATLFAGAAPINVTATVLPLGRTFRTTPAANGSFSISVPLTEGVNTIFVNATDRFGNLATAVKSIISDTTAPSLLIVTPNTPVSPTSTVWVSGRTDPGAYVVVNGYSVAVSPLDGTWGVNLTLPDGLNIITVVAANSVGLVNYGGVGVLVDTDAPRLVVASPTFSLTNRNQVLVAGTVTDTKLVAFQVNLNPVPVAPDGTFSTTLSLSEGLNSIVLVAVDAARRVTTVQLEVRLDTTPPRVTVDLPPNGLETNASSVVVRGSVDDPNATVLVNSQVLRPDASLRWQTAVSLLPGGNTIVVSAVDLAGNRAPPITLHVTYFSPIPDLQNGTAANAQSLDQIEAVFRFSLLGVVLVFAGITLALYSRTSRRIREDRRVIAALVRTSRRKP